MVSPARRLSFFFLVRFGRSLSLREWHSELRFFWRDVDIFANLTHRPVGRFGFDRWRFGWRHFAPPQQKNRVKRVLGPHRISFYDFWNQPGLATGIPNLADVTSGSLALKYSTRWPSILPQPIFSKQFLRYRRWAARSSSRSPLYR